MHPVYLIVSSLTYRNSIYDYVMILNFANKTTEDIFNGVNSKKARVLPVELHNKASRLLDQLNAAPNLEFMKVPPGNKLEPMKGNYKGKWSIRINDQWRIMFGWENDKSIDVEILDYHKG